MSHPEAEPTKVFISYAHETPEHDRRVWELSERLRKGGVDCNLDQYEDSPPEGWADWSSGQVKQAEFVLVVCTETYARRFSREEETGKGLGATWEGAIIRRAIYREGGNNSKFIPVIFDPADAAHVPDVLESVTRYDLSNPEEYEKLYRRLLKEERDAKSPLGQPRALPPRERRQYFYSSWNAPYSHNPFFTGREGVLAELRAVLTQKGVATLSGIPGMGKTQTAVEYAHRHRTEYKIVLWSRAESREALIADFAALARVLDLPESRAPEQNLAVNAAKRWLEANADWLLVLDNADDLTIIPNFLPSNTKGHTLLTTRATATGTIKRVEIKRMEPEEGALFLLRRAKIIGEHAPLADASEPDRDYALKISDEVAGLPLALDQAGAFIEETPSSPAEYHQLYRTQGTELRRLRGEHVTLHRESVTITFTLSFAKVAAANQAAADLLRACAFLAPDAIPEEIFTDAGIKLGELLAHAASNPVTFLQTIREAGRFSLLHRDTQALTFSIHRVVQDVLKDEMPEEAQRQWAERLVKAISKIFPNIDETDIKTTPLYDRLLPHAEICATYIGKWNFEFPGAALLLNNAGRYMHLRARLTDTEPFYLRALKIREKNLGPNHPDVATSLQNLGWLKHDQGKYVEAETNYLRALAIRENTYGPRHLSVGKTLSQLGSLKHAQGKFAEAKHLSNSALEIIEKELGQHHSIVADILHTLSEVYGAQGKYIEAEETIQKALEIKEKLFGSAHYELAHILDFKGGLYTEQGRYEDAKAIYTCAIKLYEEAFGPDYPNIATALLGLADLYQIQKRYADAEPLYERSLRICEKGLGTDHPKVATCLNNMAIFLKEQGKYEEAEPLFQRALAISEKSLDVDHPRLAIRLNNMAGLYFHQQQFIKSEKLLRRALTIQKKMLGQEHPDTLNTMDNLASVLQKMNRKGEAQKLAAGARKIRHKLERKKKRN